MEYYGYIYEVLLAAKAIYLMIKNYFFASLFIASILPSCGSKPTEDSLSPVEISKGLETKRSEDTDKIISFLHNSGCTSIAKSAELLNQVMGPKIRSANDAIDLLTPNELEVYAMLESYVIPDYVFSFEQVKAQLISIVDDNLDKNSPHYDIFISSIEVTIAAYSYADTIESKSSLRAGSWGNTLANVAKCVSGTLGSTLLGGLAGAAVGTISLPLVGTVSGTSVGLWGGALTGVATFC